jgi:hypothetical protein
VLGPSRTCSTTLLGNARLLMTFQKEPKRGYVPFPASGLSERPSACLVTGRAGSAKLQRPRSTAMTVDELRHGLGEAPVLRSRAKGARYIPVSPITSTEFLGSQEIVEGRADIVYERRVNSRQLPARNVTDSHIDLAPFLYKSC